MRNGVAHRGEQIRRKCSWTACVSDYAAHVVGSILKADCRDAGRSEHNLPTGVGGIPSFFHSSQYILRNELPKTNEAATRVNEPPTLRILAMMEANSVTGPAKNLIGFCRWLRTPEGAQTGLKVAIVTFSRNAGTENHAFTDAVRDAGADLHIIRERFRFDPGVMTQIREIAEKSAPDIIQTHNNKSHLLIKLLPELRRQRLWFAFHHGDVYVDFKQRLINHVDRVSLRSADRVVTVCQAFAPRLAACGVPRDRIRILHNSAIPASPVSLAERAELRNRLGIGNDEAMVLTIGRFSKEKGHAVLLRALQQLRSITRRWKLVLVGMGPERDAILRLAHSLDLSERVIFAGSYADVRPFYAAADVFALPSLSEGSSNVLLEAMAAKLPIAATKAGGNPEIILHNETGLITPIGDSGCLASAIAQLLNEPNLASRFAEAGFARATHDFSVEQYRRRLLGFYTEALETGNIGASYSLPKAADRN
jgi:glycosyltransferase involved in cell wall biosynthesis